MASKRAKFKFSDLVGGDHTLWIILLVLSVFSILVIYSSTASIAYRKYDGDTSIYLIRQVRYVGLGLLVTYAVHLLDYRLYFKYGKYLFIFVIGLLCLSIFSDSSSVEYNQARRWVGLKSIGLTFQPADFLKIALVIVLSRALSIRQRRIDRIDILPSLSPFDYSGNRKVKNMEIINNTTIPLIFPVVIALLMVMANSLSTALIMGFTSFVIFFIGRVKIRELWRMVMFGIIMIILAFFVMKMFGIGRTKTWESRFTTYFSADDGASKVADNYEMDEDEFQKHQAQIAVASGWFLGKGPGNSTQRSNLPHPYSDYAYAFIIEEYGVLGALFVLGCYLWIFYRGIVIFRRCDTPFPSLLVLGLSLMITLQAFLHMCVSVGIAPVTGQTLPIISLGGSSLMFTCMAFGIILGVSRKENKREAFLRLEQQRKLVVEQWDHVLMSEEEMKKVANEENETGKYHGVVWKRKYKDNS